MLKTAGMEILSEIGWLASTPADFRAMMLPHCDLIALRRGQALFNAGDASGGIYGVAQGRLEIHVPAGVEGATLAHLCGVGHWVGEIAAIGGVERRVSIIAATDTELLRLSRANMQRITEQDPLAWTHFSKLLLKNMSIAMDVITAIRFEQPLLRVAATLRNLIGNDKSSAPKIAVSQSDLGAMTGLSRNTVNIALADLESLEIVHRRYGMVEITNLDSLRSLVNTSVS